MDQEHLQLTYQLITNPILRLLVYFLSGAVAALACACIYLYRDRADAYRELMQANSEQTRAMIVLSAAMSAINEKLQDLNTVVTNHLLNKKT